MNCLFGLRGHGKRLLATIGKNCSLIVIPIKERVLSHIDQELLLGYAIYKSKASIIFQGTLTAPR
jgi:hypothetical protein